MSRAGWLALVVAAVGVSVWIGTSWTMADISMACANVGETAGGVDCADRVVDALGFWPVVGIGLLLATPPAVAALVRRRLVSWAAVIVLVGLAVVGLLSGGSVWGALVYAFPMAAVGAVAALLDHSGAPRRDAR